MSSTNQDNLTPPKAAHTPGPWHVGPLDENLNVEVRNKEYVVALATDFGHGRELETLANAALIVRAVNCHEELLEALEDAQETLVQMTGAGTAKAAAAIEKARGDA